MRAFLVAVVMLSLTLPVSAQGMQGQGGRHHQSQDKGDAQKKPKVDENGYNSSISRMPDGKYDPWRTMR